MSKDSKLIPDPKLFLRHPPVSIFESPGPSNTALNKVLSLLFTSSPALFSLVKTQISIDRDAHGEPVKSYEEFIQKLELWLKGCDAEELFLIISRHPSLGMKVDAAQGDTAKKIYEEKFNFESEEFQSYYDRYKEKFKGMPYRTPMLIKDITRRIEESTFEDEVMERKELMFSLARQAYKKLSIMPYDHLSQDPPNRIPKLKDLKTSPDPKRKAVLSWLFVDSDELDQIVVSKILSKMKSNDYKEFIYQVGNELTELRDDERNVDKLLSILSNNPYLGVYPPEAQSDKTDLQYSYFRTEFNDLHGAYEKKFQRLYYVPFHIKADRMDEFERNLGWRIADKTWTRNNELEARIVMMIAIAIDRWSFRI